MVDCTKQNNILWIDYAKFIGIAVVILGHSFQILRLTDNYLFYNLWQFIYLFHMPLFFIIAGFLYKHKDSKSNIKKIFYGLLIPYIIYQFIYLPFQLGMYVTKAHLPFIQTFIKCIIGIFCGDFIDSSISRYVCGPCWFIMSMIQLRLLFNYIKLDFYKAIIISAIAFSLLKLLMFFNVDLFFCLDNTLMAIPYFCFGYMLKIGYNNINNLGNYTKIYTSTKGYVLNIFISTVTIIMLFLILKFNGLIQMNLKITNNLLHKSLILSYIGGILGTLLVFNISIMFSQKNKFVDLISKNTLFIIFSHFLLLFIFAWCNVRSFLCYFDNFILKFLYAAIISVIILVINYFVINIIQKICPIILGKTSIKTTDMQSISGGG